MDTAPRTAALLIEDKETALVARTALECAGFRCDGWPGTRAFLRTADRAGLGAIVADATAATTDVAALVAWRADGAGPRPALVVLGDGDALCAARNLDLGADDFVARPVRGSELLARVGAALGRRAHAAAAEPAALGGCSLDRAASAIVSRTSRVPLTARELALARLLFDRPGRLVTRSRLAREMFGSQAEPGERPIEQYVYQLRRKLKRCAGDALALRGIYGSGYRIDITGSPCPQLAVAPGAAEALARAHAASAAARQAIEQASA